MNVFPIIFRANPAIPQDKGNAYKEYIFGIITNSLGISYDDLFLIPKDISPISLSNPVERFDNYLKEITKVEKKYEINDSVIFISLEKNLSPNSFFSFSFYISEILRNANGQIPEFDGKIILVTPQLINPEDDYYITCLKEYAEINKFLNFDFNGNSLTNITNKGTIRKLKKVSNHYRTFQGYIDSLKLKMIRRVGHFKRERKNADGLIEHSYCHRYFYDGSKCEVEIRKIVEAILLYEKKEKKLDNIPIIYHCPTSGWLKNSIESLDTHLLNVSNGIENILGEDSFKKNKIFILLIDMIDQGATFEWDLYKPLKKQKGDIVLLPYCIIRIKENMKNQSVFTIPRGIELFSENFVLKDLTEIKINSIYLGKQSRERPPCDMCDLKIPFSDPKKESYLKLTSYFFWYLCNEDKRMFVPEMDIPGIGFENISDIRKKGFRFLPNFPEIFKENGAYLAKKVEDYLLDKQIIKNEDYYATTFICPEQIGAVEFAKNLKSIIKNCAVILIPDSVYKKMEDTNFVENKLSQFNSDEHHWLNQIKTVQLSGPKNVIIIDEYATSGHSLYQLLLLVKHFGLRVSCFFPVFSLIQKNTYFDRLRVAQIFSLYGFDIRFTPIY